MGEKYIPLYRKYRPKNLQEVVGQEHVKKALKNAIELNKISHAYLFTGPRGTGKTSIARILAKSLNCQKGPTIEPCETCPSCIDIKNSTPIDVIEIDAASNRKVEDTQNILEKIQYVPVNGKYKIYIIDEVHMLTNHAFNALLKTLEEPPENVIFILATTEPQKVLETITSRCQRFDFRRITTNDIVNHLKVIAEKEKIKIDEEALFTIAKNAAGGMRDSLALLDQVSVLDASKTITTQDINRLLGRLSFDILNRLAENIINSQTQEAIELLEEIYNSGNEPSQILTNLLNYLKNLLIVKNCTKESLLLDLTQLNEAQIKALKTQAEKIETHQITFLVEKTANYIKELKTTNSQGLWLEIAIIDLANLAENTSLMALQERITRLENGEAPTVTTFSAKPAKIAPAIQSQPSFTQVEEKKTVETEKPKQQEKPVVKAVIQESNEEPEIKPVQKQEIKPQMEEESPIPISKPAANSELKSLWASLLQNIASSPTAALLNQHAIPIDISENLVEIGCKENFFKMLSSDSKKKAIEEGASKLFNKPVNVLVKLATAQDIEQAEKKNPIVEKKNVVKPIAPKQIQDKKPEEKTDEDDFAEFELAKKQDQKIIHSDQVSMVMNLFDGKFIDN